MSLSIVEALRNAVNELKRMGIPTQHPRSQQAIANLHNGVKLLEGGASPTDALEPITEENPTVAETAPPADPDPPADPPADQPPAEGEATENADTAGEGDPPAANSTPEGGE